MENKLPTFLFLSGLPASGKTTFARRWVSEDPENRVRVNKDDLREMLCNGKYTPELESEVIRPVQDSLIRKFLQKGKSVVCDNTHLKPKDPLHYERVLLGIDYIPEERFVNTQAKKCIERDAVRERSVGRDVIISMIDKYLDPIHKFNGGKGATLCYVCSKIITEALTDKKICTECRNHGKG